MPQILYAALDAGPAFQGERQLYPELQLEGDPDAAWEQVSWWVLLRDVDGLTLGIMTFEAGELSFNDYLTRRETAVVPALDALASARFIARLSRPVGAHYTARDNGKHRDSPFFFHATAGQFVAHLAGAVGSGSVRATLHAGGWLGPLDAPLVEEGGLLWRGEYPENTDGAVWIELAWEENVLLAVEVTPAFEEASPDLHPTADSGDALVPYDDEDIEEEDTDSGEEDPWRQAARGQLPASDAETASILARARRAVSASSERERLEAVQIACTAGGEAVTELLPLFQGDPSPAVRAAAYQGALDAGAAGVNAVRRATASPDPAIAVDAITRLTRLKDQTVTARVRGLLSADHPALRAASARYLSHVAGRALQPSFQKLLLDPDVSVQQAAADALAVLHGELPPIAPVGWWEAGGEEPLPGGAPIPARAANQGPTRRESARSGPVAKAPVASRAAPASPSAPPSEVEAWLRALGSAPEGAKGEPLRRLQESAPNAISEAVRRAKVGGPPDLARGAAIAVGTLGLSSLVASIRPLVRHGDAGVRIAALQCLAIAGAAATLPMMSPLLSDPDEGVRAAAIVGLARLGARHGQRRTVEQWLTGLPTESALVSSALTEAREILVGA